MDEKQTGSKKIGRIELVLLVLVFMSPIIGAWFIYAYTEFGKTDSASYGVLLEPPVPLQDVSLSSPAGDKNAGSLTGKWSLVYILAGPCERACLDKVDMLIKLKQSLAQNSHRLQLIVAYEGSPDTVAGSDNVYEVSWDVVLVMPTISDFKSSREDVEMPGLIEGGLLLIDPAGNLVMRYNKDSDGAGILQDIKKLFHYSGAG